MIGLPINDSLLNSLYRYSDIFSIQPMRKAEQSLQKAISSYPRSELLLWLVDSIILVLPGF